MASESRCGFGEPGWLWEPGFWLRKAGAALGAELSLWDERVSGVPCRAPSSVLLAWGAMLTGACWTSSAVLVLGSGNNCKPDMILVVGRLLRVEQTIWWILSELVSVSIVLL